MLSDTPHSEKKCLNCGAILHGHYCSQCGQRDEDLHEPFWKIFAEAFSDFWHFDSKLIHTIYPLVLKPGFLTQEYIAGKRARYVHPIRLYFFVSVVFFLFYFNFSSSHFIKENPTAEIDSSTHEILSQVHDTIVRSVGNQNARLTFSPGSSGLPATAQLYEDSIHKLPPDSIPGLLRQIIDKKLIEANQKGQKQVFAEIVEAANHNFPKVMFVLLPVFAVLLKLLYIRRKVYFVDHAIFSLHFHAFAFITFLLGFSLMALFPTLSLGNWLTLILLIYLFFALRRMYHQSKRKTLLKVFLLLLSYSIFIGIAFIVLIVYSALTV